MEGSTVKVPVPPETPKFHNNDDGFQFGSETSSLNRSDHEVFEEADKNSDFESISDVRSDRLRNSLSVPIQRESLGLNKVIQKQKILLDRSMTSARSAAGGAGAESVQSVYDENYWQKQYDQLVQEKKHHLKEGYEMRLELKDLQAENARLKELIAELK